MKLYLYVKESPLGLKYLGITNKDPYSYKGSGKYWRRHLKAHDIKIKDIKTTILLETFDKEELKEKSLYYSNLWNIVESDEWANLMPESGYGTFGRKFSEETKANMNKDKLGKKLTEEHRKKLSDSGKGKSKSEEFRKSRTGDKNPFYGKTHSKEVLDKIIKANLGKKIPLEQTLKSIKGRSKPVIQLDLDGNFIREWESSKQIEKELGFNSSTITGCCKGRYKKSYKFKWKYKYENNRTNSQHNIWREENNK